MGLHGVGRHPALSTLLRMWAANVGTLMRHPQDSRVAGWCRGRPSYLEGCELKSSSVGFPAVWPWETWLTAPAVLSFICDLRTLVSALS